MSVENLARFFQLPQYAPPQQVFAPSVQPSPVRIMAGHNGGAPKFMTAHFSSRTTNYLDKIANEIIE